jgi:hypothetical protein
MLIALVITVSRAHVQRVFQGTRNRSCGRSGIQQHRLAVFDQASGREGNLRLLLAVQLFLFAQSRIEQGP